MKDIVFYSKNKVDIYSPKLLQMMRKMPFAKDFVYFCIDKNPKTGVVNEEVLYLFEIEDIPTMYVQGKKLVGPETFKWLKSIHQEMMEPQQQQQPQQFQPQFQSHGGGFQGGQQGHGGFQGGHQGPGMQRPNIQQYQQQQLPPQQPPQDLNGGLMGAGGSDSTYANPFDMSSTTIGDPN